MYVVISDEDMNALRTPAHQLFSSNADTIKQWRLEERYGPLGDHTAIYRQYQNK